MLNPNDRIWIGDGYEMHPKWLMNNQGYAATVDCYMPGHNDKPALLVVLDSEISVEEMTGKFLVLELRWKGKTWDDEGVVHIELCAERPEKKRWQDRKQGKWVESHASYRKL